MNIPEEICSHTIRFIWVSSKYAEYSAGISSVASVTLITLIQAQQGVQQAVLKSNIAGQIVMGFT